MAIHESGIRASCAVNANVLSGQPLRTPAINRKTSDIANCRQQVFLRSLHVVAMWTRLP